MATIYADGTLATGNNNGLSWADAYQGNAGLQAAFDNVQDGQANEIRIRNTFTITTKIDLDTAGGSLANNTWVDMICYEDDAEHGETGTVQTPGSYTTITGGGTLATDLFDIAGLKGNFRFWYAEFISTDNGAGHAAISFGGGPPTMYQNFVFISCKFGSSYPLIECASSTHNVHFYDCVFTGSQPMITVAATCYGWLFDNCFLESSNINTHVISLTDVAATIRGCLIKGGSIGIEKKGDNLLVVENNTIISGNFLSTTCIKLNDSAGCLSLMNNILYGTQATSTAIARTSGSILYEDYNMTNRTGLTGANSVNSVSDFKFYDAANDDYRLLPGSPAINAGRPTRESGFDNVGYWQQKQGIRRRRIT